MLAYAQRAYQILKRILILRFSFFSADSACFEAALQIFEKEQKMHSSSSQHFDAAPVALYNVTNREVQQHIFTNADSVERHNPFPRCSCDTKGLNWRPPEQEIDSLTKGLRSRNLVQYGGSGSALF
jgi:hypothetical protein